ncbi:hypothetical protein [uncultured Robinsoniella sp.]|uniref:hypothetical protein n=1 Tax=Robinsoniella sp. TaxID=2496533 RepID=UPI00374ECB7A
MKKIKKILFSCLIMAIFLTGNIRTVLANEDSQNTETVISEECITSMGTANTTQQYFKFAVKGGSRIKIRVSDIKSGVTLKMSLCNSAKKELGDSIILSSKKIIGEYFIHDAGTFYIKANCSSGTVKISKQIEKLKSQGGSSLKNATIIKKDTTKSDVLGFDSTLKSKQCYKISVPTQKLIKINFRKGNSSSSYDTMSIKIFKSTDKKTPVASGYIFEGQTKGYLYIRNSPGHQTLPGTYYIIIEKKFINSGFSYNINW